MHLKISSAKWRPFCPGGDEFEDNNRHWLNQHLIYGMDKSLHLIYDMDKSLHLIYDMDKSLHLICDMDKSLI